MSQKSWQEKFLESCRQFVYYSSKNLRKDIAALAVHLNMYACLPVHQ